MRLPALSFIRSQLSQGIGVTRALENYRDAAKAEGLSGMRTYDFQRLYSEIAAIRGDAALAIDAPKDVPGGGLSPRAWSTQDKTGYVHWVNVYQVERDSGALSAFQHYAIKSDQLLTPAEVEARALADLEASDDQYNRRTIGVTFSGLAQLTPRGDMYSPED